MSNANSCQKCGRDLTKLNQYNSSFINIIIAIICFCDDICLMSPEANESGNARQCVTIICFEFFFCENFPSKTPFLSRFNANHLIK